MGDMDDYTELVSQAQLGDERALNRLAELARARLRGYVYRITLADDLTEDILQESMLEMFKFLDKLDKADRFWPWLRRIAANKLKHHYGRQQQQKKASLQTKKGITRDGGEGIANLVGQELKQTVLAAMGQLKPRYRHVLVLRCYEEMKYANIAHELGCSEFNARRLFYRAKKALAKQLARRGLGRESLLVALVLFGKITATSEAAAANVSVTAATVKVGTAATLAAMATSKTAVVSLAATGAIAVGSVAVPPMAEKIGWGPQESKAERLVKTSLHTELSNGIEECWYYYYPPNANGAVLIRLDSNTRGRPSYCQWPQYDLANYYRRDNTIYKENHRIWASDLSVWRLPTDSAPLRDFLSRVGGAGEPLKHVRHSRGGFVIEVRYDEDGRRSQATHPYDIADEEFFRYPWPAGTRVVDNRDTMHRRGWTYFHIKGRIGEQRVLGTGRLPFVYATSKQYRPWLELRLSDGTRIVDTNTGACVHNPDGTIERYKGGSFFKGLARPWMGLHTIDTVRRDAAEQRVWFETKALPGSDQVEVTLDCGQVKLVYTIDMETDVIDKITLTGANGAEGEMGFSYLQDIEGIGSEFKAPGPTSRRASVRGGQGVLWLTSLLDGD